jgi:hypothetical protein
LPAPPELYIRTGGDLILSGAALTLFFEAILARGIPFRFRARGLSMHPFIKDGDVVTISPIEEGQPGLGVVVAFLHPENRNLTLHRIVGTQPGGYLVRGDNAVQSDGLVSPARILGFVSQVERDGKVVKLGFGPERRLIGWLSRHSLLNALVSRANQIPRLLSGESP